MRKVDLWSFFSCVKQVTKMQKVEIYENMKLLEQHNKQYETCHKWCNNKVTFNNKNIVFMEIYEIFKKSCRLV